MRPSQSVAEAASFEEVVDHIEHSHDDIFPVVDKTGTPVGMIRYDEINKALYDPDAVDLILAADIMQPLSACIKKSDEASEAIHSLHQSHDDCLIVTDDTEPFAFIGVVRRSDVTTMLIRERKRLAEIADQPSP